MKYGNASMGYSSAVENKLPVYTIIKMNLNSIFLSKNVMNKNKIYSAIMHTLS